MAELDEKDFIQEGYRKNPRPMWFFVVVVAITVVCLAIMQSWQIAMLREARGDSPFLNVTNREMSLFLWQNPEWLRNNVRRKTGYLPGFDDSERIGIRQGMAENIAMAPPEVLYRYHAWQRLISDEWFERPIPRENYLKFLNDQPEWMPQAWPGAGEGYADLIDLSVDGEDLAARLPPMARTAYQGWLNFFHEGEKINGIVVSRAQARVFIAAHPEFARPLWKNLFNTDGMDYLSTLGKEEGGMLASDEMPAFLRVALYNASQLDLSAPTLANPSS